jgi:hypothetical protein
MLRSLLLLTSTAALAATVVPHAARSSVTPYRIMEPQGPHSRMTRGCR